MNRRINHPAVWLLVVLHQIIGFGYYALLGNVWLNLHARTMSDIDTPHDFTPYFAAVITAIVVNYALAWLMKQMEVASALCGLKIALLCWFCFLFVEHATISAFSAFGTNPWPLVFLDMGRAFLCFAASGLILGGWQRKSV